MFLSTINEGYGRVYEYPYSNFQTDPRPRILLLGKYKHPNTGNINIAGINLNYIDSDQLKRLRQNLKAILQPRNLQLRYWRGRRLLPDIFQSAYRTYTSDYIGAVTRDTLTFWPSASELERAEQAAKEQELQKYDQETKAAKGIRTRISKPKPAAPPSLPMPAPEPTDVVTTEPEPVKPEVRKPGTAPPEEVELARPEKEVTPERPETKPSSKTTPRQRPAKTGAAGAPTVQPEVEETPTGGLVPGAPGRKAQGAGKTAAPKAKLTSAQRRRQQAKQIKNALDASKKKQKPEPPDELKGVIGLFKPKK